MARYCQRGCGKPVKGTARFCGPEHKRDDYNERKRDERIRAIAAARKLLRSTHGGCECANCDGSCKTKRGRPAASTAK